MDLRSPRRALGLLTVVAAALCASQAPARADTPTLSPSVVGEPPSGGAVFRFPQAVGFSPGGGSVFVADQFSGVVQAFNRQGVGQFSFGSRATRGEQGRIGVVGGVATDHSGHVYVLDSENDRVQVFDASNGTFVATFGDKSIFNLASGGDNDPDGGISASGIAVRQASAGDPPVVWVADEGNNRVERFTLNSSTLQPTQQATSDPGLGLRAPQGIAIDPAGSRLYVADDQNNRILVLDPTTLALAPAPNSVGTLGKGPGQIDAPYDVAVDARTPSQLYVADNQNHRVDIFDAASLGFVKSIGGFGSGVGSFEVVRAVGALADDPQGGVTVADTANNRLQSLDAAGTVQAAWGIPGRGPGYVTRPRGVAIDGAGNIVGADTYDERVVRFEPDGTYVGLYGQVSQFTGYASQGPNVGQYSVPADVAYDDAGDLWVADTGNDRLQELTPAGSVGYVSPAGTFKDPRAVAQGPSSSMYVADTDDNAVKQIVPGGTVTTVHDGFTNPAGVAWDGASKLYVSEDTNLVALDLSKSGNPATDVPPPSDEAKWSHPWGVAVDRSTGTLYVAEGRPTTADGARVLRGTPGAGGTFTWDTIATEGAGASQVIEPHGIALSPDGKVLLVADTGNNRLLRFDAPGSSPPQTQLLSVSTNSLTRGVVSSNIPGITCVTDCTQHYGTGRVVTLTATPTSGSVFTGWSGACAAAGTNPACSVTMSQAQTAGASFGPAPTSTGPPPSVLPAPIKALPLAFPSLRLSAHSLHGARKADRRRHRKARKASHIRVSYKLTRAATVIARVQVGKPGRRNGSSCIVPTRKLRKRRACTRFVTLPVHRTLHGRAGTSVFSLTTPFAGRTLKAGSYRLALTAADSAGNRVGPKVQNFKVTR